MIDARKPSRLVEAAPALRFEPEARKFVSFGAGWRNEIAPTAPWTTDPTSQEMVAKRLEKGEFSVDAIGVDT